MKQSNVFIDQKENNFYWLMWEGLLGTHCFWENGTLAMRHNHNGRVYGIRAGMHLDVAVGAMVADY